MSVKVNEKTGQLHPVIRTWRNPREAVGLKNSDMIIHHKDFAYDPDIRGLKIVEKDKEDREAYIQSFADDCGVYNVLKKYSKTGDVSLLNARTPVYGDVASLPVDNLDPEAAKVAAAKALTGLNKTLGSELTAEQLAKLSSEELNALISKAVEAAAAKAKPIEKKEGE